MTLEITTQQFGNYLLTTKHPQSSYGLPVLVDSEGVAYSAEDAVMQDNGVNIFGEPMVITGKTIVMTWADEHKAGAEALELIGKFLGKKFPQPVLHCRTTALIKDYAEDMAEQDGVSITTLIERLIKDEWKRRQS